jgi:hypothetical protein
MDNMDDEVHEKVQRIRLVVNVSTSFDGNNK